MGGILNPSALSKNKTKATTSAKSSSAPAPATNTFNTSSGGQGVTLTAAQQAKIAGTNIGKALGVSQGTATQIRASGSGLPITDKQIDTVANKFNPSTVGPNGYREGSKILEGMNIDPSGTLRVYESPQQKAAATQRSFDTNTTEIVSDNGTARTDEKNMQEDLKFKATRGPLDLTYLDQAEKFARDALKAREAGQNSVFNDLRAGTEASQLKETGSTSAGLARAGGYLGFTGSGEAVMLSLAQQHRSEIQSIEAKRAAALADARQAYADRRYDIALEKQKELDQYEKDIYTEQLNYADRVRKQAEETQKKAEDAAAYESISAELAKGTKNEADIYRSLGGKVTPEQIKDFYDMLKPKTVETDPFKPTNNDMSLLLGAGMGQDDIQVLTDYINTNGYDEIIKASLTPYQRRVMDSIFTLKPEKTKSASAGDEKLVKLTATQKNKLVNVGFTADEIYAIESDISKYGLDAVLEGYEDPTPLTDPADYNEFLREADLVRKGEAIKQLFADTKTTTANIFSDLSTQPVDLTQ